MLTITELIAKTPGVCGGEACIRGTRIPVWVLVEWHQLGKPEDWLLANFPGLTPADLAAAWEYSAAHSAEIEQAIRKNREA